MKNLIKEFLANKFGYEEDELVSELEEIITKKTAEEVNEAYSYGYDDGYDEGSRSSYDDGYDDGYNEGLKMANNLNN